MSGEPLPVVRLSRYPYRETIERLCRAIVDGGNTVFATIDQAAAAARAGLTLRPTTLIVFGNPAGGTPLMARSPLLALDLPLKFLIFEEAGAVSVAYAPMSEIARRYGVTEPQAQVAAIDRALGVLAGSVA
jgi:uncharacterized protein (DUF302 family)